MTNDKLFQNFIKFLMAISIIIAAAYLFKYFLNLVTLSLPFILGFIGNYLCTPFVRRLERKGYRRNFAVIVVFAMFSLCSGLLLWLTFAYLYGEIAQLIVKLPSGVARLSGLLGSAYLRLSAVFPNVTNFDIRTVMIEQGKLIAPGALAATPQVALETIIIVLLAPVFTFFLMRDGRHFKRALLEPVPNRYFEISINVISRINEQMGDYIRGRFYEASIIGVMTLIAIGMAGFTHAGLYAMVAAITNVIPYIGPLLCVAIGSFIALIEQPSYEPMLVVMMILTIIQLLDLSVIYPLAIGITVRLHPLVVIAAVILGSKFLGIIGLVLAVPVVSIIKVIYTELIDTLWTYRRARI